MLRSLSGPSSSIGSSRRPAIRSITAADTSTPPIGACSCRRDTTLMPSPRRSVPSTVTAHVDGAAQLEPHRRVLGEGGLSHRRLHGECCARGVDRAGELDQQPVAQRLEDAPAARDDQRIDRLAQRPPRAQHTLLVGLDEGAEVDDVERHDHDQPAAPVRGVAGARPRTRTLASHAWDPRSDDGRPNRCEPKGWRHRDE